MTQRVARGPPRGPLRGTATATTTNDNYNDNYSQGGYAPLSPPMTWGEIEVVSGWR